MKREISYDAPSPAVRQGDSAAIILKRILGKCINNWYWFAVSLVLALIVAWFYVQSKQPVYQRSASIIVKQSGGDGMDKTMKELGIAQASTNLTNEILLLNSRVVAEEVVKRLRLNVNYLLDGTFYEKTLYGINLPFNVEFFDLGDNDRASLKATLQADSTLVLADWKLNGQSLDAGSVTASPSDTVQTPFGKMVYLLVSTDRLVPGNVHIKRSDVHSATERVRGHVSASLRDKSSSIIDIRYRDVSLSRADDVLSTLITVYNEQWMKDRNKQIVSTNDFIRERLAVIEQELGNVDRDISSYKSENLIPDVSQAGAMAVAEASETAKRDAELSAKISQLRTTFDYLAGIQEDREQIPLYPNIENVAILQKISEYNQLVLKRNNHLAFSSAQNPLVVELGKQLAGMRSYIIQAISNEIALLQAQQGNVRSTHRQVVSKVARNPQQANYLLSVERQQKVKESLYLFLLQKREENELSQAFTAYNTQLIEPPHGNWAPIEPVARNIYLMAVLLGLALPLFVMLMRMLLTTTVQNREDLKSLRVPFAGEIPQMGKKKRKNGEQPSVLVSANNRDAINESFRVVRSNLEFLLGYEASHKVVMLTSMDPGSGKTFVCANLSTVVGLKGKKVLAIDLDLRRASLSEYAGKPHNGISGYLSGKWEDYHDLIVRVGEIDIMPCGALPPNPSELLYTERFAKMMETVRTEYDYVFLDCPPVEMVADPAIINRFADLTIFLVRAKLMEKSMLQELEQWYDDKKFNNLVILLNGTDISGGRYGYHRYGYHYYNYSYGHSGK